MSIKNIIQQENDLQEMSTQSLANYLNNPTGQYNPYLVAGELQRKEAFAQRQAIEPPQGTVIDELVEKAMPMGGMPGPQPMPGPPMGSMPPPSQAGISSIPTPNMQPSFAAGGIVGYAGGEEVGFFDKIGNFGRERLSGLEADLDERIARDQGRLKTYEETGVFPEMTEQDYEDAMAVGGLGAIKSVSKATPFIKDTAKKGIDYIKNKFKPAAPKTLTKAERAKQSKIDKAKAKADKAAQKKKDNDTRTTTEKIKDKAKELYSSTSPDKGPLTRAGIAGLKGIGQGAGPLTRAVGKGLTKYPVEAGLGTYGAYKAYDYFDPFGTRQKEAEEKLVKENKDSMEMNRQTRLRRESNEKVQAELDAQQAKRDRQREKEMYLALALGGAKTMAGQSPYALANIGEGLGAGVGALAAYDQNEMERMTASQAATLAAQQKMQLALMDEENNYRDRVLKLLDTVEYQTFKRQLDEDFNGGDIEQKEYDLKLQNFMLPLVGLPPGSRSADINGQQFVGME